MAQPLSLLNEALHFTKLDRCCRCGDDFWLDQGQKKPPFSEVRCLCSHPPCRACTFSSDPLLQVDFHSKPYKVADPEEAGQVHLKLCCQCGTPTNVSAMPIVERRTKLRRWGVKFASDAAQCVQCQHAGCSLCPCFVKRDDYVFKCTREGKKETGSRSTAKSVSHSVRSLASTTGSKFGGWFAKLGSKLEKSAVELPEHLEVNKQSNLPPAKVDRAVTAPVLFPSTESPVPLAARLDSPFSAPVFLDPGKQSKASPLPGLHLPAARRTWAPELRVETAVRQPSESQGAVSPISQKDTTGPFFEPDGQVSPL